MVVWLVGFGLLLGAPLPDQTLGRVREMQWQMLPKCRVCLRSRLLLFRFADLLGGLFFKKH